jgi:hypothetical protein
MCSLLALRVGAAGRGCRGWNAAGHSEPTKELPGDAEMLQELAVRFGESELRGLAQNFLLMRNPTSLMVEVPVIKNRVLVDVFPAKAANEDLCHLILAGVW